MKILITGATGLIGKELGKALALKDHQLVVISRSAEKAKLVLPFPCEVIEGDLEKSPLLLPAVDAVIHLAGTSVAEGRWTAEQKKSILESRVLGTRHLLQSLSAAPSVFISSSAIGIYGDRGDEELTESSSTGPGFLAEVCKQWEAEAEKIHARSGFSGVRTVYMRTGVVLARSGGALEKMLWPFRAGIGAALASGQQKMSWIHIDDLVQLFIFALENPSAQGAINAVAEKPVSNLDFSKTLAKILHRPLLPNIPTFVLKILFGEMAVVLTASQNIKPTAALNLGFAFRFKDLQSALDDLLAEASKGEDVFYAEQFVPATPEKVFPFFSEAQNLEKITPDTLNFKIKNMSTPEIGQGTLIDYRLKIHGVPAGWRTLIDQWQPPFKFVDTQLKGPYSLWHHTHEFKNLAGGTLMTDRVRYKAPLGYLGWLAAGWLVKKDVSQIFSYRRKIVDQIFKK
ncbi:MAG: TIGR01777 family oxidoreductase [Pseudobdellovibrionaceae bacterium]